MGSGPCAAGRSSHVSAALVRTKLTVPEPPRLVERPRLREALDQLMHRRAAIVSAPAGFGKSTAVADWVRRTGRVAGWVTLDQGDNDPARFLAYVIEALRGAAPRAAAAARQVLESTHPITAEPVLAVLVNGTRSLSADFVLVLDDYHVISSQAVHDSLELLLDHLPPRVHLVIASRADPPLPLARLRSQEQIVELRAAELRFTSSESEAFFNTLMRLELSLPDVQTITGRTEGWIAGMRLVASSLRGSGDPSEYIRRFSGSERHVADYLSEEVLRWQPPATLSFLLQTSIVDQLCAELCTALTGITDSPSILRRLETDGLFLEPLDAQRTWYRYHPLFADILRQRLHQHAAARLEDLHRRASAWYAENGMVEEAIDHALAGKEYPRAAALVQSAADDMMMNCRAATFLRWAEAIPPEVRAGFPVLCVIDAAARVLVGRPFAEVRAAVRQAEACNGAASVSSELAAVEAFIAYLREKPKESMALARTALTGLTDASRFLRTTARAILGILSLSAGDTETAEYNLELAIRDARRAGNHYVLASSYDQLAAVAVMRGRLGEAERLCREALELSTGDTGEQLPVAAAPLLQLAEVAFERNDIAMAEDFLAQASAAATDWSAISRVDCRRFAARLAAAKGDIAGAEAEERLARELAARYDTSEIDDRLVEADHAALAIRAGGIEDAARWASARRIEDELARQREGGAEPQSYHTVYEREYLVFACLELARGRAEKALEITRLLQAEAEAKGLARSVLNIRIVAAMALDRLDRTEEALTALAIPLELAEKEGFVRPFVDAGIPMAHLLDKAVRHGVHADCAGKLLAAFPLAETPGRAAAGLSAARSFAAPMRAGEPMIEPLSPKEIGIVKLLSAGLSNKEIADREFIAVQTVKWHTSNIYAKLGVKNRTQAVARARGLGIIPLD